MPLTKFSKPDESDDVKDDDESATGTSEADGEDFDDKFKRLCMPFQRLGKSIVVSEASGASAASAESSGGGNKLRDSSGDTFRLYLNLSSNRQLIDDMKVGDTLLARVPACQQGTDESGPGVVVLFY